MTIQDLGARCDRHVGEAFQPRCFDCDTANRELEQERAQERHQRAIERNAALGITPNRQTPRRRLTRRR
ncbi:hypothetical protein [Leifsonia shinshuensis]|uniref:Uncharacterized protein n=1 Tax=Leifsonia shinshuensis TaxID=150026 RepID=A0A853CZ98_9MICO|nr:hypothetical protein [Leifsonia shinshuensis]NYJ23835.1 hypothetical protein [Leifsonia shinshuensis]